MDRPDSRALVLGLGNPLSGDDGFGGRVMALLNERRSDLSPGVTLVDAHTDLLNHIGEFAEFDLVVLVDAVLDAEEKLGAIGQVAIVHEERFSTWTVSSESAHQMTPLMAVKLFRTLNPAAATRIELVGLFVDRIGHERVYATDERTFEAAAAVQSILPPA